jgi:hypothetical protein
MCRSRPSSMALFGLPRNHQNGIIDTGKQSRRYLFYSMQSLELRNDQSSAPSLPQVADSIIASSAAESYLWHACDRGKLLSRPLKYWLTYF